MKIRKFLLFALAMLLNFQLRADEGMWLPHLLKALNEQEMQDMGMKLSAEDIYSVNHSSMKDAIVSFGGFCTGEVISSDGLLLTNHHCGYGQLQAHSSVENDLLTDGFWAMDRSQELSNPGLFVTFIVRIEDVTEKVLHDINHNTPEEQREALVAERIKILQEEAVKGTHYGAQVKPFFYGNEYYMFITETYEDVRLVGAPPSSIGKFGGDTDNWMFPRHTGDFSLFRIYAGPDGKPAPYSPENVPLKPKYHLPVSLDGIQKGDFTMVFGFPGRTEEYLPSMAVDILQNETNPHRINLRDQRLAIMDEAMKASDEVRIQYAAKYAGVANSWKKWIGQNRGLKRLNTIEEKRELEKQFQQWVRQSAQRQAKYGEVVEGFEEVYEKQQEVNLAYEYLFEAVFGVEAMRLTSRVNRFYETAKNNEEKMEQARLDLLEYADKFFKDYHAPVDQKLFAAMMKSYEQDIDQKFHPEKLREASKKYGEEFDEWAEKIYKKSALTSREEFNKFFKEKTKLKKIEKDPLYELYNDFITQYRVQIQPVVMETMAKNNRLNRLWMAGLREMQSDKLFYPDANSTMRITYGKVNNYEPQDGVVYDYYTTLEGVMEKEDPSVDEFIVEEKLKELYDNKNYGPYANAKGEMPVCFTASNHTTGGNSGSPVINAEGELIGLNFDRNWEGTMSDIDYDPEMCRNIAVDIRYVLFIIDKFAGAGHLVEEMTLVKENQEAEAAPAMVE
jgi:hypothetical protein